MAVFVLDKRKKPLMPCSEKRARLLLNRGRARVHLMAPFTIRLVDRTQEESVLQPIQIKIDPGSKTTGVAVVREESPSTEPLPQDASNTTGAKEVVLFLIEIVHRGAAIREALARRRGYRRNRRARKTRYRAARFNNRTRKQGWLPPSLQHRVDAISAWVARLSKLCPIVQGKVEGVRFDAQLMEDPEISGIEYQQGTLEGYEVREYLLEKGGRCCAYCGKSDLPLQIDHIHPRARGGSHRVSNLTLACRACNQAKGALSVEEFLQKRPDVLKRVLSAATKPLASAAAVNATRKTLVSTLKKQLPIEEFTGGRTKYNRQRLGIPKTHALDAACVGIVDEVQAWKKTPTLVITCMGRGSYMRARVDKHGAVRVSYKNGVRKLCHCSKKKSAFGFQTGDLVKAKVPSGIKLGTYIGRVAIRHSGSFNIQTASGTVEGISYTCCQILQRGNGYNYSQRAPDRTSVSREGSTQQEEVLVGSAT